jgi:hypothetical protein
MASRRCGCASDSCACVIDPGPGIDVTGSGTTTNPYVIEALPFGVNLAVNDEATLVANGVTLLTFKGAGISAAAGAAGEVIITVTATTGLTQALAGGKVLAPLTNTSMSAVAVTFPVGRFTEPPMVVVSVNGSNPFFLANSDEPTADGVVLVAFHRDGANVTADVPLSWIARQLG